jgi:hypothetical protein
MQVRFGHSERPLSRFGRGRASFVMVLTTMLAVQHAAPSLAAALARASEAFERWRFMGGDDWQGNTPFLYSQRGS